MILVGVLNNQLTESLTLPARVIFEIRFEI